MKEKGDDKWHDFVSDPLRNFLRREIRVMSIDEPSELKRKFFNPVLLNFAFSRLLSSVLGCDHSTRQFDLNMILWCVCCVLTINK